MAETQMQLEDWLDDLCARFIINLPEEDLSSVARICFQVEEAQWFYEDFIRPLDPSLPSMPLRTFCLRMFQHCPLLASFSVENHTRAFEEFLEYKTRVPVRGAIMLNHEMDSTVLVKGWKKGANWSFPRGKINKDESDLDCAIREVWEETGLDLRAAGLVPKEANPKYIEISMREQQMRLYVFRDIPMNTHFQPMTRKEISKIQWYKLSELPAFRKKGQQEIGNAASASANKFYMVAPFLVPLKKWVGQQKRMEARKSAIQNSQLNPYSPLEETQIGEDAWTQTVPDVPRETPAIETLEGATMELQRLLKVQPPTQGLQLAPAQESKASALLSILQKGRASETTQMPQPHHEPHDPLSKGTADFPQFQNPHHPINQSNLTPNTNQPHPPLYLQQKQQAPGWDSGYVPQDQGSQQPYEQDNGQSRILHPQPLPPQVQKSIFAHSTPQPQPGNGYLQNAQSRPPMPDMAQAIHQLSQNSRVTQTLDRSVPLDNQSIALLNAFRKMPDDTANQQVKQSLPGSKYLDSPQPTQIHKQPPLSQAQAQAQRHPVSAGGGLAADAHRSALLGMFKIGQTPTSELPRGAARILEAGAGDTEKQLLDTLQSPARSIQAPLVQQAQRTFNQHPSDPSAALSDFLALKPKSEQGHQAQHHYQQKPMEVPANPQHQLSTPSSAQHTHSQSTQPRRILQRGQNPEALGLRNLSVGSQGQHTREQSPSFNHGLPMLNTAPDRASLPSPASSVHHAGGTQDQKRQLLSLFSKSRQQSPLPGNTPTEQFHIGHAYQKPLTASRSSGVGAGEPEFDKGSPRHEYQNPMSPADKSFLLDYLQSVTTNTKP